MGGRSLNDPLKQTKDRETERPKDQKTERPKWRFAAQQVNYVWHTTNRRPRDQETLENWSTHQLINKIIGVQSLNDSLKQYIYFNTGKIDNNILYFFDFEIKNAIFAEREKLFKQIIQLIT